MSVTDLAPGSQNVIVVDGAKLEVRAGSAYLGAKGTDIANTNPYWTLAGRIHSKYDSFVNNQGYIVPMRIFYTGTTAVGDNIDVWLPVFDASGNPTSQKDWYQIIANAPATPLVSKHRYYFAEWFDNLNNQNRVVFTYGSNTVASWTGGFAPITAVTPTTLKTNTTWVEKGFLNPPEGVAKIVINGVEHALTSGDFSTDTITVASTTGITAGNVAFQALNFDTMPGTFVADVCSFVENQVYYLSFTDRHVYISWAVNEHASFAQPVYAGSSGLNDAVFSGTYTGTTDSRYKVTIDSVAPNNQTFTGLGVNDAYFGTAGYTGTGTNTYKVSIVADWAFTFTGTPTIIPSPGDILVGTTSGAIGKVVFIDSGGQDPVLVMQSLNGFEVGETITGTQGTYGTVFSSNGQVWAQTFKNGIQFTPVGFTPFVAYEFLVGTVNLIDGVTFIVGTTNTGDYWVTQHVGDFYQLVIGDHDTFSWSFDGTPQGSNIPVSTSPTFLSNGISVTFQQTQGHALGDSWVVLAYPEVIRGWRDFYFDINGRTPTQGFLLTLDSNGFTMKPQENTMYIVDQAGKFSTITFTLASNLETETVTVTRLKSEQQNSPLFPYLMGYSENQLVSVSQQKTWDLLGRQKLMELPQFKTLSDDVRYDFETSDWTNGDMLYASRKQFFSVPEEGKIFMWDAYRKYWNPPQVFGKRVGLLSIIDGKLCGHSYEKNETYELFKGDQDVDNLPIDTAMIFPYDGSPYRMGNKAVSAVGMEGYVTGAPDIKWKINCGVGGCQGTPNGVVNPFLCIPNDTASLGKSSLGFHGLGNDPVTPSKYFNYIKTFPNYQYFLRNIELRCKSDNQRWSIISIGTDVSTNNINNASIVDNSSIVQT